MKAGSEPVCDAATQTTTDPQTPMSLKSLFLRDFVIVTELEIELSSGFTVMTGETGAGKSILIDALQLALGARAEPGVVREGAQRCEISASFDAPRRRRPTQHLPTPEGACCSTPTGLPAADTAVLLLTAWRTPSGTA